MTKSQEAAKAWRENQSTMGLIGIEAYKQSLKAEIERTRNLSERNKVTVTRLLDEVKPIN